MRSAVALRSFMILHLFSMTEAMCLKSSRDEKTSPDTKKFIESTKTSKDFQTDLLENYINTIINQWKKGRTGRLVDDQSGTWKISLNHEKLGSGELLAKMTQEGLRRMVGDKVERAKLSRPEGLMRMVEVVGDEVEGVVEAWENLLPDILACYASLSGDETMSRINQY